MRGSAGNYRRPLGGDEEEAEDEAILRPFDTLGIEQRRSSTYSGSGSGGALSTKRRKLAAYAMAGAAAVLTVALVVTLSVQAAVGAQRGSSDGPSWTCPASAPPPDQPGSLTFFVIGDWGRQGTASQRKVAKMMSQVADCMPPRFILSTGDNFYGHGLRSGRDAQVARSLTGVYDSRQLAEVPWYAVLGNHDYNDGIDPDANSDCAANTLDACPEGCCYSALWQHTGRLADPRWHLSNGTYKVPPFAGAPPGLLDVVLVDTNPFIRRYRDEAWYHNAGGIWQQRPQATKAQLRALLAASPAMWKLVVGHHPISSFGQHCKYGMQGDCKEMAWLEPELQAAGVAAYLSGHDHDLQHNTRLSDPADASSGAAWPHHVVSGAGSDTRAGEKAKYKAKGGYEMEFMTDDSGFVAIQVNASHLAAFFYGDSRSRPVHTFTLAARPPTKRAQPPPPAPAPAAAGGGGGAPGAPRIGMAVAPQAQALTAAAQQQAAAVSAAAAAAATRAAPAAAAAPVAVAAAAAAVVPPPAPAPLPARAAVLPQPQAPAAITG